MGTEVGGLEAGAGDHLAAGGLLERIVTWAGQVVTVDPDLSAVHLGTH